MGNLLETSGQSNRLDNKPDSTERDNRVRLREKMLDLERRIESFTSDNNAKIARLALQLLRRRDELRGISIDQLSEAHPDVANWLSEVNGFLDSNYKKGE